jgi:phage terminase large subunit-like protein
VEWSTACPDWERRIIAGESLIPFPPLFPDQAELGLRVFNELCLVDVDGSTVGVEGIPRMGEVSRQWLIDFVSAVFGSYDEDTGRRLIQEFFLLISKKNTKSTTAAGLMLTLLILNWRLSAELLLMAPTIEIANNAFDPIRTMISADEELSALLHVQPHLRTVTHRTTGAVLKVVAADAETVGGKKAAFVLIDELWIFGKRANAENMIREATGGQVSRPEGCTIYLSTQSDEPPAGIFKQKLDYARAVRDGRIIDNKFLPVIYEFPEHLVESGEYENPDNFYITNPMLGASVEKDWIIRKLKQAHEAGPESVRGFVAKHLNVQIGLRLMENGWPGAAFWEEQGTAGLTLEALFERCDVLTVGIDGGGLSDLLGLAVLGRERVTGNWLHWGRAWAHPIVLERHKGEASKLLDFEKDGDLIIVNKIGEDVQQVVDVVMKCEASGLLDKVGVDRAGIGAIVTALEKAGIELERIIGINQGWHLNGAIKTTERKVAEGALHHGDSALMAYSVGNARIEQHGNAVVMTKQTSGSGKIDMLMALFNAVVLMLQDPRPRRKSYTIAFLKTR